MSLKDHLLIVILLYLSITINGQESFVSPLNIPLSLSGNFGELRSDHFHSGIDIKTQGVTGKEVFACADGFVYLILVSPVGFGKAIYLRHPFGLSTVYAHLDHYSPEIEEYVKKQQYRLKTFAITITPPPDRLPVKKGQLIGYSGNTGGSTGPHLHFEVRKSAGEKPVDPLKYNFGIEDNLKPVFQRLAVYPESSGTVINRNRKKVFFEVTGGNGSYGLPPENEIEIYGTAGFGISVTDFINNMPNRFGISTLELYIDSLKWFTYEICEFSFSETRYVNAHIDYETRVKSNVEIEKLFVLPNDKLSLYRNYMNNGLFDFTDNRKHEIRIIASDTKGNRSVMSFIVKPASPLTLLYPPSVEENCNKVMPYGRENSFEAEGVKVSIPSGALYDTLRFTYSVTPSDGRFLSPIHMIHNRYTPLHSAVKLAIRPDSVPAGLGSKMLIAGVDDKGILSAAGGSYSNGYVTTDIRSFGSYAITIDTIPPVINSNGLKEGSDLSQKGSVSLKISDRLSGIKSFSGLIDDQWALFEYDAKNDHIFYVFDPERITKDSIHKLVVTVSDNCNNSTTLVRSFTW